MGITIQPQGAIGAEIHDVDLNDLSEATLVELRIAYAQYGVLFFRDQQLTPEAHIELAQHWGKININRFFTPVENYPQIAEVRKEPDQKYNVGGGWHTDHSYDQIPALGSLLYAKEVPSHGGDTLFAGCGVAFDNLSEGMKDTLRSLRAVHSSRHVFGESASVPNDMSDMFGNADQATQDAVHPVVIRHPLSGREILYVNPGFTTHIEGWTVQESAPLLQFLYGHIARPEHTCRFHWQPGALAFWDNRATWHFAVNDYHGERRLMHRITVEGEALTAAL
ncbi:MAG: TauD/TfdA family dioxygenase [Pseudomonadota bacterium]|nr:TauD/TfdA family dioxygenase [Pseudomonadota bacterium]|tara:strand:+ start:110 stop:946 length:837 start_codon:yes stop_codon:yes gene_type:complete